jgi:hypothetical protein
MGVTPQSAERRDNMVNIMSHKTVTSRTPGLSAHARRRISGHPGSSFSRFLSRVLKRWWKAHGGGEARHAIAQKRGPRGRSRCQTIAGQKPQDLGITTYESICHEINASPPATPSIYPLHTHRSLCRAIPIPQRRPEETQPQHQPCHSNHERRPETYPKQTRRTTQRYPPAFNHYHIK